MDGGLTIARPLRSDELRSLQFLADIDLVAGEAAMFSGGAVFLYGAEQGQHRCGEDGCDHTSDCAIHNEPALPNGPCDCGLSA